MNHSLFTLLRCPVCHSDLSVTNDGKVCYCQGIKKHCFDFSRSGYLHLGGAHTGDGDNKEAVRARRAFLDAGFYQPLSDKLGEILAKIPSGSVLDAGCGEGYYTNRMAASRDVIGVDLSRDGIDYAARRAKQLANRAFFAVASVFETPVKDSCIDVVTNLFAPCAEQEFLRVLKPGGHLLLVGAGERHLMGLKQVLYENPYVNPGRADLPAKMEQIARFRLQTEIIVRGSNMIDALFSMTPYYWRTSKSDRAKLESIDELTTETDFDIFVFRKGL